MRRSKLLFKPPSFSLTKDKRTNLKKGNYILHFGLGGKTYSFSTFTSDYDQADYKAREIVNSLWNEWRHKRTAAFLHPSPGPGGVPFSALDSIRDSLPNVYADPTPQNTVHYISNGSKGATEPLAPSQALLPTVPKGLIPKASPSTANVGRWAELPNKLPSPSDLSLENQGFEPRETTVEGVIGNLSLRQTYQKFYDETFITSPNRHYAPGSLRRYREHAECFLSQLDCRLEEIDRHRVKQLYREMTTLKIGEDKYQQAKSHFGRFIRWCLDQGLLKIDPCSGVRFDTSGHVFNGVKRNRDLWSEEELGEVLKHFPPIEAKGIWLYWLTGMDQCDIARIEEEHIVGSGKNMVLDFYRQKTKQDLEIPLAPGTKIHDLVMFCMKEARKGGYRYIFNPSGLHYNAFTKRMDDLRNKAYDRMGVPKKARKLFKTLRHTAITRAKENGLDSFKLKRITGLSKESVMLDTVYNKSRVNSRDVELLEPKRKAV